MRRTLNYPLGFTFFGLTPSYRTSLFKQIHEIVFFGKGGYDWHTIYNMPMWLRNLTFNLINNHFKEQNNQNKAEESWVNGTFKQAAQERKKTSPPTYITKASKK